MSLVLILLLVLVGCCWSLDTVCEELINSECPGFTDTEVFNKYFCQFMARDELEPVCGNLYTFCPKCSRVVTMLRMRGHSMGLGKDEDIATMSGKRLRELFQKYHGDTTMEEL